MDCIPRAREYSAVLHDASSGVSGSFADRLCPGWTWIYSRVEIELSASPAHHSFSSFLTIRPLQCRQSLVSVR